MKIGIIKELKTPPDTRVPLSPKQCAQLKNEFDIHIVVQSSDTRCFSDQEYKDEGIAIVESVNDCDVLLGVKEVPIDTLVSDKHYFFFSHTIKKQEYNRGLLRAILSKNIQLTDYETITNEQKQRLIAFGKFAGMVGAHNAIYTWNQRNPKFDLPRMNSFKDYEAAKAQYQGWKLDPIKIVLTGTGRVSNGAAMVLRDMGIEQVAPLDYVLNQYDYPVFTQLNCFYYVKRKDGKTFDKLEDFYQNPEVYESDFDHFLPVSDIMINGIYWDTKAPAFFTKEQMQDSDFKIKVISDVTCDIAPDASIPSTLKASTIADPIFGYDPQTGKMTDAHGQDIIDMTTIDNLPNELPRDASSAFGTMFLEHVAEDLIKGGKGIIDRATITQHGELTANFSYLQDYVNGKE